MKGWTEEEEGGEEGGGEKGEEAVVTRLGRSEEKRWGRMGRWGERRPPQRPSSPLSFPRHCTTHGQEGRGGREGREGREGWNCNEI
jgi:hypothetical protein